MEFINFALLNTLPFMQSLIGDPVLSLGLASFFLLLTTLPFAFWASSGDKPSAIATTLVALSNFSLTSL